MNERKGEAGGGGKGNEKKKCLRWLSVTCGKEEKMGSKGKEKDEGRKIE